MPRVHRRLPLGRPFLLDPASVRRDRLSPLAVARSPLGHPGDVALVPLSLEPIAVWPQARPPATPRRLIAAGCRLGSTSAAGHCRRTTSEPQEGQEAQSALMGPSD